MVADAVEDWERRLSLIEENDEASGENGQFVVDLHIDAVTGSSAPFRRQEMVMP